jgi:predicted acylesterase/phospholipase RssA
MPRIIKGLVSRLALLSLLAFSCAKASSTKCYALAFSSGDQSAAYQAGALQGLISSLTPDQYAYHTVTGVSGGAVNSVLLAAYP